MKSNEKSISFYSLKTTIIMERSFNHHIISFVSSSFFLVRYTIRGKSTFLSGTKIIIETISGQLNELQCLKGIFFLSGKKNALFYVWFSLIHTSWFLMVRGNLEKNKHKSFPNDWKALQKQQKMCICLFSIALVLKIQIPCVSLLINYFGEMTNHHKCKNVLFTTSRALWNTRFLSYV